MAIAPGTSSGWPLSWAQRVAHQHLWACPAVASASSGGHDVLEPFRGGVCEFGVGGWCGAVDHALARTATVLGRWAEAEAGFRGALRIHEAWGAVPLTAATLTGHANMLRRRNGPGDRARAAKLSVEATHLSRAKTTRAISLGSLTARESDILGLVARGASNKEIARVLTLSVHTVERHVANIYHKTGARNRAEATAYHLRTATSG